MPKVSLVSATLLPLQLALGRRSATHRASGISFSRFTSASAKNRGNGFAITTKHIFQTAMEVQYQDELPVVFRPSDSPDTVLSKSLLTKSSHWKYEHEWRIVKRTMTTDQQRELALKYEYCSSEKLEVMAAQNGPGLYSFPRQAITEVILGVKMADQKRQQVLQWIQEAKLDVPIYQARRHLSEFRLEFTKLAPTGGKPAGHQ